MSPAEPKPRRGDALLERRKKRQDAKAAEAAIIRQAKARDNYRCRYPGCRHRNLRLDGAHWEQHRGMGGDPKGTRTESTRQILTLCVVHHAMLDRHEIVAEPLTEAGADWAMQFLRQDAHGKRYPLAEERAVGIPETRGA